MDSWSHYLSLADVCLSGKLDYSDDLSLRPIHLSSLHVGQDHQGGETLRAQFQAVTPDDLRRRKTTTPPNAHGNILLTIVIIVDTREPTEGW